MLTNRNRQVNNFHSIKFQYRNKFYNFVVDTFCIVFIYNVNENIVALNNHKQLFDLRYNSSVWTVMGLFLIIQQLISIALISL